MSKIQRVLIIGGGIGGLTAAVALKRQGIDAEVVEQNAAWTVYGVGIIQPSNALRALRSVGLGDACLAQGRGFKGWQFRDRDYNELASIPSENVAGPGYPENNGIQRSVLHKILTEATLGQGTRVRLGVTVASIEPRGDRVDVTLSDGQQGSYDLVIGADGMFSKTRGMLFPNAPQPQFTGQCVWRYNFERPRDLEWGQVVFGHKSKAGLVPLSETLMYMFLVTAEPGNPRLPADRLHELLRERTAEYGGLIAKLREQIVDPAGVVYRPLEVVMVPAPWHQGRVVLIGDAVHGSTPQLAQGAAMAVEDAVLLAEMLGSASDDIDATLRAFTERRLPRAKLVYDTSVKLGQYEMIDWELGPQPNDYGPLFGGTYAELMKPI